MHKAKLRKQRRRVSLNTFKPQADLQPYLQQQLSIAPFEQSLMLMQILQKHQKIIFKNKQNQVENTLNLLEKQNQLLSKISQEGQYKKKQKKVIVSSFKVLEELDLNRQYAYQTLEQENKEIYDRIYALQTALQKIAAPRQSEALNQEYLSQLQNRILKRKKTQQRFKKLVDELQENNEDEIQKMRKKTNEILGKRDSKKIRESMKQGRRIPKQQNQIENLLQAIFAKLQE